MPPKSRRRKKYDDQLRSFQNRNFFAFVLLLVFIGLAIWLTIRLLPGAKPTVFVSTNYIDHSGSREIPFAEESCNRIRDSFGQYVQSKLMDNHQVDQKNSMLELPKEQLGENGVLVVYLNGHLVNATDGVTGEDTVGFLGPEAQLTEKDFGEMLKQIDKSPAKLKLVFVDAGRYSWSPVYPKRPLNTFSSSLAKALKDNRWNLNSDNLWVIASHSDHEISQVSTPLKCSLFSKAIAESVVALSEDGGNKLNVFQLFEGIRRRTTSWSRNFKNQSLQTPVLIQPRLGVVDSNNVADDRLWEFAVKWTPPEKPESDKPAKEPKPRTFSWQSFASRMPGEQAGERVVKEDYFDAAPYDAFEGLESFIELGDEFNASTSESYEAGLTASRQKPDGNTLFSLDKIETKHREAREFRKAVLGMAILDRFRNEMQFWEDDGAINQLKILEKSNFRPNPVSLSDSALQTREKLPATLGQYAKEFQDYRRQHAGLIGIVQRRLRQAQLNTDDRLKLTPTQAELLGRTSQRYLPLVATFEPKPEPDPDEKKSKAPDQQQEANSFLLDEAAEASTSKFGVADGLSVSDLYESASTKIAQFAAQQTSDTDYRFLLAAGGTEETQVKPGKVPSINWSPVPPSISFDSPVRQFRVNPYDMDPITLSVSAQAVEMIQLSLAVDGEIPAGLEYGLSTKFERKRPITFEDGDLAVKRSKPLEIYLRHRSPKKLIGKPIALKITASCASESIEPVEFPVTVRLSRDPTVQLVVNRELGVGERPETKASLIRWGGQLPENWKPLTINSLANVRSAFEFSLVNNSSKLKSLRAELFNVVDLPRDFGSTQLYADRPESDQVQELSSWLFKQQRDPGAKSLELSNPQRLYKVAESSSLRVPSGGERVPVSFSVPLIGEKQEPTEAALQEQEADKGMIVVFYEDGATQPAWFQWLAFEPIEPADATVEKSGKWLKPLPDILDVFQEEPDSNNQRQRNNTESDLVKNWNPSAPKDEPGPAATLTTISEDAYAQNRHFVNRLDLKNIFQGQSLIPKSRDRPALLILDLLGVPNYGIFELRGDAINQASFRDRLTGVRVSKLPGDGWESHPKTWSLVGSSSIVKTGDEADERVIYLRRPEGGASGELKLELLLPVDSRGKVLGSSENDFKLTWRNGTPEKLYPNHRLHFVQAARSGLTFWTTVRPHYLVDSSDSFVNDSVLEIRRSTGGRQLLGRWRFVTEPPVGRGVTVRISKEKSTLGELAQVTVQVDLSRIKPALDLKNVSLTVDGSALKNTKGFLQNPARSDGAGKFKFPYNDLVREMGVGKIGSHEVRIEATNFFGGTESGVDRLDILEDPKPVKIEPKLVKVRVGQIIIEFENDAGEALGIGSLIEFDSLTIDGNSIPLDGRKVQAGKISGYRKREKPPYRVYVYELKQGKHQVRVDATLYSGRGIASGVIDVKDNGQVFKLKLGKVE